MGYGAKAIVLLIGASLLGGCTWLRGQSDEITQRAMGAEPLAEQYAVCRAASANITTPCASMPVGYTDVQNATEAQQWIGGAAADSYSKCMAFVARMAYGDNLTNAALDITAVSLAGAGAITAPLRSAQTLAALAGIATASRAAINSDIFMQNTAPVIAQKINSTYNAEMKTFLGQTATATQGNLGTMYAQLEAYQSDCTLTGALAALGNGTTATTIKAPLTTDTLKTGAIIADPTAQQQYKVTTAYSSNPPGTFSYVQAAIGQAFPPDNTTAQSVAAAGFLTKANTDGAFLLTPGG
jgi:hypothetical protein